MEGASDALRTSVIGDVEQMEAMITAVLAFIRDASEPHHRERLDLLSLLECAVDDAALVGQRASLAEGSSMIVNADALGLRRLFDNLIDNAVKYGGSARVSLAREGDDAVVRIADEGPGLSQSDLERVFEPFYRTEPSRHPALALVCRLRGRWRGRMGAMSCWRQPRRLASSPWCVCHWTRPRSADHGSAALSRLPTRRGRTRLSKGRNASGSRSAQPISP